MTQGISPQDLRYQIIRPSLEAIGLGGDGAEELLLGTAAQESGCGARLLQVSGPALGLWQMEPGTHADIWANFLVFRKELATRVSTLLVAGLSKQAQLVGNLYYSCAMARVQYLRSPHAVPAPGDLEAQAQLYKVCYNTPGGAASVDEYIANARRVIGTGGI